MNKQTHESESHRSARRRGANQSNAAAGSKSIKSIKPTQKHPAPPAHPAPILLRALNPEAREEIIAQCCIRRYAKGEHIIRESEDAGGMYFINRGRVQVTSFSCDGVEVNYANLESGDNFGALSLIDGQRRLATVTALVATDMLMMSAQVFWRMLERHPAVLLELMGQMGAKVRRLHARIDEYSTTDVNHRIRAELLRLAYLHIDLDCVARIPNMPTHAQLAGRVSCHREAVSRELKALERAGILEKRYGKVVIPDIARLQRKQTQDGGRGRKA